MSDDVPPTPTPVLDHRKARDKTALEQVEAQFTDNLVGIFHTVVMRAALEREGSQLAPLTLAQMQELLGCLREALAMPTSMTTSEEDD